MKIIYLQHNFREKRGANYKDKKTTFKYILKFSSTFMKSGFKKFTTE